MKSKFIIILFMIVSVCIMANTAGTWQGRLYKLDPSGYHLYLPAIFIYNDVTQLSFYPYLEETYNPSGYGQTDFCIYDLPNGNRLNRYTLGVAMHEAPFFLAAHWVNTTLLHYPADGYSTPYEIATLISTLFYVLLGLIAIRKLLANYFPDIVVAITIAIIAFGTNIYYYTVFKGGGCHTYSFFHMAMLVWLSHRLYTKERIKYFYYIAIILGLATLTRPVNAVFDFIPLLWGLYNGQSMQQRLQFLSRNVLHVSGAALVLLFILMIQLGFWKYITGSWYYDAYKTEGFVWEQPEILKGMFSFRKGWLIYAPLSALGLAGIYFMRKSFRQYIAAIIVFLAVYLYFTYCWWSWWYGGCFGSRPMVDITPILALPTAVCIERIFALRKTLLRYIITSIISLLIALQIFQSYQYHKNVIHYERMTARYYFRMFFRTNPPTEAEEEWLQPAREIGVEMSKRLQKSGKLPSPDASQ